jgi:transposase-like protein
MARKQTRLVMPSSRLRAADVLPMAAGLATIAHSTRILETTTIAASVAAGFVECPYCDGENTISAKPENSGKVSVADQEIACKHCQCLFLVSESHRGIRFRSVQQAGVA